MKKLIITGIMFLGIVLGVYSQQAPVSASANLFLQGTVGNFVSIQIAPTANSTSLPLSIAQNTPLQVADVTFIANVPYFVSFSTTNDFQFSNNSDVLLPYTLYLDSVEVQGTLEEFSFDAVGSVTLPVQVSFPAAPADTAPGTFFDTVTINIESN